MRAPACGSRHPPSAQPTSGVAATRSSSGVAATPVRPSGENPKLCLCASTCAQFLASRCPSLCRALRGSPRFRAAGCVRRAGAASGRLEEIHGGGHGGALREELRDAHGRALERGSRQGGQPTNSSRACARLGSERRRRKWPASLGPCVLEALRDAGGASKQLAGGLAEQFRLTAMGTPCMALPWDVP